MKTFTDLRKGDRVESIGSGTVYEVQAVYAQNRVVLSLTKAILALNPTEWRKVEKV